MAPTIAVPLSPDTRDALIARLAPKIGWADAEREVARAAAGYPSNDVQKAIADLWGQLAPAVEAVKAAWAETPAKVIPPTDDIVPFLRARLDQDQEDAERGYLKAEQIPDHDGWDKSTTAELPPAVAARVLRDIASKRRIMERHHAKKWGNVGDDWPCDGCGYYDELAIPVSDTMNECPELRDLAAVYADHPDYQEAWRP